MTQPQHASSTLSRVRERAGVRARALRTNGTAGERLLWRRLRNRQPAGFEFRRQHPIGAFFADFACVEAGLIVELDGGQHFEPQAAAQDVRRTAALNRAGITVLRFGNRQALQETDAVLPTILQWLQDHHHPHPSPLPPAGEGVHTTEPL